jgi:hypothetical protein
MPDRALYLALMSNELSIENHGNDYTELTLLNSQGKEIVRVTHQSAVPDNQLLDHSKSDDYLQPASTRRAYYSPVSVDTKTGQRYFTISVPLSNSGNGGSSQLSGVIIARIGISSLGDLLTQAQPGPNQNSLHNRCRWKSRRSILVFKTRPVVTLPPGTGVETGFESYNGNSCRQQDSASAELSNARCSGRATDHCGSIFREQFNYHI